MADLKVPAPPRLPDPPVGVDRRNEAETRAMIEAWMQQVTALLRQVVAALP